MRTPRHQARALREAESLAAAVTSAFGGRPSLHRALVGYERDRDRQALAITG